MGKCSITNSKEARTKRELFAVDSIGTALALFERYLFISLKSISFQTCKTKGELIISSFDKIIIPRLRI